MRKHLVDCSVARESVNHFMAGGQMMNRHMRPGDLAHHMREIQHAHWAIRAYVKNAIVRPGHAHTGCNGICYVADICEGTRLQPIPE